MKAPTRKHPACGNARILVAGGAGAGPLFVTLYWRAGRREMASGYSPRRDPVSAIVRSPGGWRQTVNFLVTGLLFCLSARGLRRGRRTKRFDERLLPAVVAAIGVGLIGAGIFPTDIIDPKNSSETPSYGVNGRQRLTLVGAFHTACAVPVFTGMPFACFIGAKRLRSDNKNGLSRLLVAAGIASITAATLHGRSYSEASKLSSTGANPAEPPAAGWLVEHGGTMQRIALVTGFGGISAYLARIALRG
jgi:Protein of unknown function (DUF998)